MFLDLLGMLVRDQNKSQKEIRHIMDVKEVLDKYGNSPGRLLGAMLEYQRSKPQNYVRGGAVGLIFSSGLPRRALPCERLGECGCRA